MCNRSYLIDFIVSNRVYAFFLVLTSSYLYTHILEVTFGQINANITALCALRMNNINQKSSSLIQKNRQNNNKREKEREGYRN